YSFCRPRHSPPFPTRRSSDLSILPGIRATATNLPAPLPGQDLSFEVNPPGRVRYALRIPVSSSAASRRSPLRLRYCTSGSTSHRSEEHTSELQSRGHLVCRLL